MKNLTTAIFAKMTPATDLYNDIGGRLYKGEAPEGAELPYGVFMVVSDVPEYPGGKTIERVLTQFSFFSQISESSSEIEDILTHLRSLYDDCTLTITGNTQIYFIRGNLTQMRDEITTVAGTVGVWHYSQEYAVMMVKN